MKNIGIDKIEARAIFRRSLALHSVSIESPLLDCIADVIGEVIEENNKRLLEQLASTSQRKG